MAAIEGTMDTVLHSVQAQEKTGETQVATLLCVMGVQATQIYDTFTFQAAGDKDKHDVV